MDGIRAMPVVFFMLEGTVERRQHRGLFQIPGIYDHSCPCLNPNLKAINSKGQVPHLVQC